jgi:hypothetical protein
MTNLTTAQINQCQKLIDDVLKQLKANELKPLLDRITALETKNTELNNKVKELEKFKAETIEKETNSPAASSTIWSGFTKKTPEVHQILNEIAKDQKDRKASEKKAILFGLTESLKETDDEKKIEDDQALNQVLSELNFDKNKIKKFFRLKNKSNNSAQNSKPRPIIIEFNETSERDNLVIASNKKKITDIFINKDLSESERHLFKKQRDQCKSFQSK